MRVIPKCKICAEFTRPAKRMQGYCLLSQFKVIKDGVEQINYVKIPKSSATNCDHFITNRKAKQVLKQNIENNQLPVVQQEVQNGIN